MNRKLSRAISLMLAILVTCGMSGCTQTNTAGNPNPTGTVSTGEPGGATKKDTVIIAAGREPPTLDTMNQNYMMTCVSALLTHNCLMRVDEKLNPEPDLAESYEAVSDTEWIFKLHQGVKFHNGQEMTAEDIKATLDKAATVSQAQQYVAKIASVEVVDPYTIKIVTSEPSSSLLMDLTNQQVAILCKEDIENNVDFNTHINGTGPYQYVSYIPGDKLEYVANDNYFDPEEKPTIKHMIWRFIPEGAARTIALESGEVDYLYDLATVDVPKLEENPKTEVLRQDSVALTYLLVNNEVAPFDNVLFRKAISAAIDRESIVKVSMSGFAKPAISCTPTGFSSSTDENAVGYDLELAKQYLKESGVDPSTVKMPMVCANDESMRTGAVIQANLAELGIEVELVSMDNATWLASYNGGDYTSGITQLAQRSMQQWATTLYHSKFIGATNGSRLNDATVDELLDRASVTLDAKENQKILTECAARLNELCPVVPLYNVTYVKAYSSDLGGANCNATGAAYYHWLFWK